MVAKLYAAGICNRLGELYTGGKLKQGNKYILDNTHYLYDDKSVDIREYYGPKHYGIGLLVWFDNITDLRPQAMIDSNIW